ncbi:MAG: hypothetical protein M0Q43_13695 [Methanothrix sp.]|jgi:hypothetical protein|nr:hypothetical protein [Methanothrix sp.]
MRFKILILSSLLFIAFLAVTALCVNWDNPSYDTDEMISSGEVETVTPPAGQAATPKLSRDQQKNKSSLDWTMPSTLTGGGDSAKNSRTQAEAASEETVASTATEQAVPAANTSAAIDTELPPVQTEAVSAGGNWYFTLNDSVVRDLALVLFQKGNEVFGAGKIKEGNNTQDVTASGAVADATLELNLVSANPIAQYKLNLDLGEDFATGEYQAFSASGESWTGSAEGQKTA